MAIDSDTTEKLMKVTCFITTLPTAEFEEFKDGFRDWRREWIDRQAYEIYQESLQFQKSSFYVKSSHPMVAYLRLLIYLLRSEKKIMKKIFIRNLSKALTREIYETIFIQFQEISHAVLRNISRSLSGSAKHDHGEIFVLIDILENLYKFDESLQIENLRNVLAKTAAMAVQYCIAYSDEIKISGAKQVSIPENAAVHELTSHVNILSARLSIS
jgi:hypothetical protein